MKHNTTPEFQKLNFNFQDEEKMIKTSKELYKNLSQRRTVRSFSTKPVPKDILNHCLLAASSSPSGANKQPYKFVVVESQSIKEKIKEAAEKEEELFYTKRASEDWLDDLKPFKTNQFKPYLAKAPFLIAVFAIPFEVNSEGKKDKNYYPIESTGLATGSLISCLHMSGLATLTHTPSPLNFLNEILNQPKHYKPMILLVTGYPEENTEVPKIERKPLHQLAEFI